MGFCLGGVVIIVGIFFGRARRWVFWVLVALLLLLLLLLLYDTYLIFCGVDRCPGREMHDGDASWQAVCGCYLNYGAMSWYYCTKCLNGKDMLPGMSPSLLGSKQQGFSLLSSRNPLFGCF
jgi:hypothetical protein